MSVVASPSQSLEHQPRSIDPFTLTYQRICEGLWRHQPLADYVRPGNRISRIVGTGKGKTNIAAGDAPELDIMPSGWNAHLFATSSSSMVVRFFSIEIKTGANRADDALFDMEWELMRALACLQAEFDIDIGLQFISNITFEDFQENESGAAARGLAGWTTIGRIRVDYSFPHSETLNKTLIDGMHSGKFPRVYEVPGTSGLGG